MPIKQKIKKRIVKKSKKTKKGLTQNQSGVLLEEMNSKIDIILEGHTGLDKKIDKNHKEFQEFRKEVNFRFDEVDKRFNGIDKRFDGNDKRFDGIDSNFKTVFGYLSKIDNELQDIQIIKSDIKEIKQELGKKSDLEYVKKLEQRMNKIGMNYIELRTMVMKRK